jgi:hypothetical protein
MVSLSKVQKMVSLSKVPKRSLFLKFKKWSLFLKFKKWSLFVAVYWLYTADILIGCYLLTFEICRGKKSIRALLRSLDGLIRKVDPLLSSHLGLGFRDLGFRGLGFRGLGFRGSV